MFLPFTDAQAWATLAVIALYWAIAAFRYFKADEAPFTALIQAAGYMVLVISMGAVFAIMCGLVYHSIKSLIA